MGAVAAPSLKRFKYSSWNRSDDLSPTLDSAECVAYDHFASPTAKVWPLGSLQQKDKSLHCSVRVQYLSAMLNLLGEKYPLVEGSVFPWTVSRQDLLGKHVHRTLRDLVSEIYVFFSYHMSCGSS